MVAKSINATTLLASGIAYIVLGICLFFINQLALKYLLLSLGVLTIIFGIYSIFKVILDRKSKIKEVPILTSIRDLSIGTLILLFPDFILHSFSVCFGLYLLLHTIINAIEYFLYRKNKVKGRLRIILNILFLILFLVPLLFNDKENIKVTAIILGIYLIGYGCTHITDFLTVLIPKRTTEKIKQQIQIPLPVLLNAFIPRRLITLVNEKLDIEDDKFSYKKASNVPDIYVLIHLAKSGTAAMGHMEVAFDGKIISYGNYDMHSRSLFDAIGDGVILVADKEKYIRYMVEKKDRYIIEFGLTLTAKEKKVVQEQIEKLISTDTEPYYSDLELANRDLLPMIEYHDMSSELSKYADGTFYKITKGKYKKFFVLKTNCAMVAQFVLSSIGKQILCVNGIITPGAYYDYLNARFKLKNTNVISRKVYTMKDFQKKQD